MKKIFLLTVFAFIGLIMVSMNAVDAASRTKVIYPKEGDCRIVTVIDTQYAIDVDGGDTAQSMSELKLQPKDDYDSQVFTLKRVSGEWYKIVHKSTGYVVNVKSGEDGNHVHLWLYKDDGTDSCYWRFLDAGNGAYVIQSKLGEHRIIDLSNSKARSGGTIQIWDYHDKDAGRWKIVYESRRSNSGYGSHRGGHGRYGGYDDDDDDDDYNSRHRGGGYGRHGGYDDDDDDDDYYGRHRDNGRHGSYGGHSRW